VGGSLELRSLRTDWATQKDLMSKKRKKERKKKERERERAGRERKRKAELKAKAMTLGAVIMGNWGPLESEAE
jgi:hypothetical protein